MVMTLEYKMEVFTLILCVMSSLVTSITVSPNGNSPETKMVGGMVIDTHMGVVPMESKIDETKVPLPRNHYEKSRRILNSTKLSINERYRRLIPYMTFYYANNLASTLPHPKNIEVEKAEVVEAKEGSSDQRQPKRIVYSSHRNIPRYEGNRLTQYNIALANPTKVFYKDSVPVYYHSINKQTPNFNPLLSDYRVNANNNYEIERPIQSPIQKPSPPLASTGKPYLNLYAEDNTPNVRYYLSEKEQNVKYKLVPYEQTPPVKVLPQSENYYDSKKPIPVPVLVDDDNVYKPRPARPQYYYDNVKVQAPTLRKQPVMTPESYYKEQRPKSLMVEPVIESGFKPIANPSIYSTEAPFYTSTVKEAVRQYESQKQPIVHVATESFRPDLDYMPEYHRNPERPTNYRPDLNPQSNAMTLSSLVTMLQRNKSIPKPITKENVGPSIKTLLQVLNAYKIIPQHNDDVGVAILTTAKPLVEVEIEEVTQKTIATATPNPISNEKDFQEELPYLAPVHTPSQYLDDGLTTGGGTSQQFPLPAMSDEEGGTPGRPGIDYPILPAIPSTKFNCKTQRYKGFFADPDTRCQVWHYCDLNGGQASFLCPNGTIFSQAGLTCDWWFNVRCASTTQLYVLNESLYKFILPHSPKFPEDYSGPLVDKYLTLKFKEMEEEFKKKKNKKGGKDKSESDEEDSKESVKETDSEKSSEQSQRAINGSLNTLSEASVIVESPGSSGNVERLKE